MASCITIVADFLPLCCDGQDVTGSVVVSLVGPKRSACQLYDPIEEAWVTPGVVGTFRITNNVFTSCPLMCLDELEALGGVSAIELGFYYSIEVKITGAPICTYVVALDCLAMGLSGESGPVVVKLEDVITEPPVVALPGSALCNALAACGGGGGGGLASCDDLGTCSIEDLADVAVMAPTNGQVLTWNGTAWAASTPAVGSTFTVAGDSGVNQTINAGNTLSILGGAGLSTSAANIDTLTINLALTELSVGIQGTLGGTGNGNTYVGADGNLHLLPPSASTTFTVSGDTGAAQTISASDNLRIYSGTGLATVSSATDTVTVNLALGELPGGAQGTLGGTGTANTYVGADGQLHLLPASGGGGPETTTTLTDNGNGTLTYTNELGAGVTFKTVDREKIVFTYPNLVTQPGASGFDIEDIGRQIYAIAVTVVTAPTGNETFNIVDKGTNGLGNTVIYAGTLVSGTFTTGIVAITPYTLALARLLQSNILTVNGSEGWSLHVFYRELVSELDI